MPIIGKTDSKSAQRSFGRLGTIRKGIRHADGSLEELDYFRFVPKRGPYEKQLKKIWLDAYGEKPINIEVYLMKNTVEENWKTWKECYGKSGLKFRCNGVYWVHWRDEKTLQFTSDYEMLQKKVCPYCSGQKERTKKDPGDREVGYLEVMLMPFFEHGFTGVFTVITTSLNDLPNITNVLYATYDEAVAHGNTLRGIPFNLMRVPETIQTRFQNKEGRFIKMPAEKHMIHIMPSPEWARIAIQSSRRQVMLQDTEPKMLSMDRMDDRDIPVEHITGEIVEPEPIQTENKPLDEKPQTREEMRPEEVIGRFGEHIERLRGRDFTYEEEEKRESAMWKIGTNLNKAFDNPDDIDTALTALVHETEPGRMDDPSIEVLKKYLSVTKVDGEWVLDSAVVAELKAVVEAEKKPDMPSLFADWKKMTLAKKRKYITKIRNVAKENGFEVPSYTDDTMDETITILEDLLKNAGVG